MIKKNCIEIKNLKVETIKKYFQNWAIGFLSISLSLIFLLNAVIPFAHATDKITYNKNDNITNQAVKNNNFTSNNIPSPNNVTITRGSEYNSIIVNWKPPTSPPSNYTYQVDLLNNISSVSQTINHINSNTTNVTFNNLSTGNWKADVYTIVNNDKSEASQSSTPVSVALSPTSTTSSFNDITNLSDNFQTAIKWAASYSITAGYSDGGFHPATPTTRGQMATFFHKLAGNPTTQGTPTNFTDISKSVHKADINWLSTQGITAGYTCTNYKKPVPTCIKANTLVYYPEGKITRTQMASFLYKFASAPAISKSEIDFYLNNFKDKDQIIASGQDTPIAWLVKNNITAGYTCTSKSNPDPACTKAGDTIFRPKYNTTRQQMVLFLQKAANTLNLNAYLKTEKIDPVTFLGMSSPNRNQITKISWQNTLPTCTNPTDVSADGRGGILACNNNNEIIVGEIGGVFANPNSSYLLSYLSKSTEVNIDLTNLNTNSITNMSYMFFGSKIKSKLNLPNDFGSNVTDMTSMFESTSLSTGFSFPSNFGSIVKNMNWMFDSSSLPSGLILPYEFSKNAENMTGVFAGASLASGFSLPAEFGKKALNIDSIFANTSLPTGFSLPAGFGSLATDMDAMWQGATLNGDIDWSGTDLTASTATKSNMFQGVIWNNHFIYVLNEGSRTFLITNSSISDNTEIKVKNAVDLTLKTEVPNPTNFLGIPSPTRDQISKISWQNTLPTCASSTDVSANNDNSILACVVNNTEIVIGANGSILANNDSSYLFANLSAATEVNIDLTNLNTIDIKNMAFMFSNSKIKSILNLPNNFGSDVTNMNSMFENTTLSTGFSFPTDFGSNITNMDYMFANSSLPSGLLLPYRFSENVENMIGIFAKASLATGFSLPSEFGNKALNITNIFADTSLPNEFSLPSGFGNRTTDMSYAFKNATLPAGFLLPAGFGREATDMANMFQNTTLPANFILPNAFGTKAINMTNMLQNAKISKGFTLPNRFGQAVQNMDSMFYETTLNNDIDWSGTDLTNLTASKSNMFNKVVWNNHFIYVQNEGSKTFLITNTSISDNARIKVKNAGSPILKTEVINPTNFLGVPSLTRDQITKISWQSTLPTCASSTDVSANNDNSVLACVVNNTEIVIGANGSILANNDSSWLFANLTNIAGIAIDLTNLDCSGITNMNYMFKNSKLKNISLTAGFGSLATNMSSMFLDATLPTTNFSLPVGFGSVATNMSSMFLKATLPTTNFSLPAEFGSAVTNMSGMFLDATLPTTNFSLPAEFGAKATDTSAMFFNAILNSDIDWTNTDLTNYTTYNKSDMFYNTTWNGHFIYVQNEGSRTFLITNSSISDNTRIKVKNAGSPILKAEVTNPTNFLGIPNPNRNQITKISFQNTFPVCANPTDVSVDGKGGVIACVVNNTEIVIGADGPVLANDNSSYLFTNLSITDGVVIDLTNLDCSGITNMNFMFRNSKLKNISLSAGFGNLATNMTNMFGYTTLLAGFSLPAGFGNVATNMKWMFRNATLNGNIDWSNTDLTNFKPDKDYMFYNTIWNNRFIYVQNEGSRTFLITDSSISDNTRIKVKNAGSPILKAEVTNPTNFLGIPNPTRDQITKISWQSTLPTCADPTDVSANNDNSVLACVVNNTEIVIGANGSILANNDSSYLFANLSVTTGVDINLTNLDCSDITNMSYMLKSSKLKNISLTAGFGSLATNMSGMFLDATLPTTNFSLPTGFGSLATNMSSMFLDATLPTTNFSLPTGFGSVATSMNAMFYGATLPTTNFSLPARFGSLTLDMNAMFYKTILNSNIDWTGTDLINYTAYKSDMFYDTTWNNHFIYVQNEGSKTFLITDSSISDNSRVKVKE